MRVHTDSTVGSLRLAPIVGSQAVELVHDILDRYVSQGWRREWAGNETMVRGSVGDLRSSCTKG